MMFTRHVAANALTILILVLFMVLAVISWGESRFRAPGPSVEPVVLEVKRGDRLSTVTEALVEKGLISSPTIFRLAARYSGADAALKFGEYEIPAGASMEDILSLVTSGRGVQRKITIPEGWTSWQVVQKLNETPELTGEIAEIPPEGSLAPNTYFFGRGDARALLIEQMTEAQKIIVAEAWSRRAADLPYDTPEEMVTMASIIEKETGVNSERDKVAGVFVNRLRDGIRLQTDPSVIYGITGGKDSLGRGLRRSELARETPYNTYIIDGLPPGPIANPGLAAIEAAVNPAKVPYYYFVADGSGGHVFAETLAEHNVNVAKWREIEAQQAAEAEEAPPVVESPLEPAEQ